MKKILFMFTLCGFLTDSAYSATPWWEQPTVCRLNPTNCYSAMGAGFDSHLWDSTSKCWGLKLICPQALTKQASAPVPMGYAEIRQKTNINTDYDTDALSLKEGCFGLRKTKNNGATVSVNGTYVKVFCKDILDNPDEVLANGEIMHGSQPTCKALADSGYVAIENDNCYGKYFAPSEYYIDCGSSMLPDRIIALNGADYNAQITGLPRTQAEAKQKFDTMYNVSQKQKAKYFNE